MLPATQRLRRPEDFRATSRQGRRAGSRTMSTHLLLHDEQQAAVVPGGVPARAGLVVGKGVGTAVTRNRVKRRLRHLLAERIATLPQGATLVVRANGPAAAASYDELGRELDGCLDRVTGLVTRQ